MDFGEYRCSECGEMLVEMPKECPNCLSQDARELLKLRHELQSLRSQNRILREGLEETMEILESSDGLICDCEANRKRLRIKRHLAKALKEAGK